MMRNAETQQVMNESNKAPLPQLVLVAFFSALASVGMVALAFCLLSNISGNGMWAIAAMAAAPSLMGTGIAYFMTRHARQDAPKP
jgi:membrane protein YqaA with SNARE-associated domain